jgi:hypothetical protein
MVRYRKLIWPIIVLIAVVDIYLVGMWKYDFPKPLDLFQYVRGNQISISKSSANRYFTKFAPLGDLAIFWTEGVDNPNLDWDTSVTYTISFRGRNNLSTPERVDSIWVFNCKTQEVYLRTHHSGATLGGEASFSGFVDLREGYFELVGLRQWIYPDHNRYLDSLVDARFNTYSLALKLFTSAGTVVVVPEFYRTYPFNKSRADSVRAA